ncbi:MAG: HD domain-containing protein [Lachnospiraceae bacterium]|nr:HD domain-containing protein [Lachnospiraceae bacterium]
MKDRKAWQICLFVAICILLNILGKMAANTLRLPIWLDSMGTIYASYVIGPVAGCIVGVCGNLIGGVLGSPLTMIYALTSIGIGVVVGNMSRKGWMETLFGTLTISVVVTLLSVVISTPISLLLFEGRSGNLFGDGVFDFLRSIRVSVPIASAIGEFYVDFADKVFCLALLRVTIVLSRKLREYRKVKKETQEGKTAGADKSAGVLLLFLIPALTLGSADQVSAQETFSGFDNFVQTIYSRDNGLPCGEANDIEQTKDGVLWIGTYAGLYRYNGSEFRWMDDYDSVRNVNCLYQDDEGRLWIGTNDRGVTIAIDEDVANVLDEGEGLPSNSVRCITQASDGYYYVGTSSGLEVLELNGGLESVATIMEVGYAVSIAAGENGIVAANTSDGMVHLLKGGKYLKAFDSGSEEEMFTCCSFGPDGLLYVGSSLDTVYRFEVSTEGKVTGKGRLTTSGLKSINSLSFIEDGPLIACADDGIGYFNERNRFIVVNTGSFNNSIDQVELDYQGNLWFTSSRMGLLRLAKSEFVDLYTKAELESAVANTIAEWDGVYYIGTDTGLDLINRQSGRAMTNVLSEKLEGVRIRCIFRDSRNDLWICTYGEGLWQVKPDYSVTVYDSHSGTFGSRARMVIELQDGSIAAAGDTGVSIIKDGKVITSLLYDDGLSNAMILCLLEEEDGSLLAGTDGDGIILIRDGEVVDRVTAQNGLPSGVIMRIVEDKKGDGWFIVTSNSLCYMDHQYQVRELDNFPYYNNYDVWDIGDGRLFVLGSAGIYVVDKELVKSGQPLPSYEVLDHEKGLLSALTANSWDYLDENGILYMACDSGIYSLNVKDYGASKQSYRMLVSSVKQDGVHYPVTRGEQIKVNTDTTRLEIFPEVINYTLEDPYVMYWMEGMDDKINTVLQSDMTSVTYTNLPTGDLTFHLAVLDQQGNIIEESNYDLKKEANIYENTWFRVYMFAVAMLAVAWLTWFIARTQVQRTLNLQKKELEFAKKQLQLGNETILAIAKTVDAKDVNTSQHSMRVSEYSVLIADRLGFSKEEQENIRKAALLHDIGKIGIPDRILNKNGKLTDEEYAIMKSHVTAGAEILKDFTLIDHVVEGAKYHHERFDGKGYPSGLKGEAIPLYGRIICVADAFDAMTANRVYRKKQDFGYVLNELQRCRGSQFDPKMVDILLNLIEDGSIDVGAMYEESIPERDLKQIVHQIEEKIEQQDRKNKAAGKEGSRK